VNKLVQFSFFTLKRSESKTIFNNTKKDHHNKRSLHRSKFPKRSEFQIKSAVRKEFGKKSLRKEGPNST
jgi:hypothetical protein